MEKEEAGNAVPIDRFRAEEDAKEDALKQVEELDKENIGLHETIKQLDLQLQELIDAKDRLNQRLVEQEAATQSALERYDYSKVKHTLYQARKSQSC